MNAVNEEELAQIEKAALEINSVLSEHMDSYGITLVDFKLEFGKTSEGEIILADEISLTPAVSGLKELWNPLIKMFTGKARVIWFLHTRDWRIF